MPNIFCPKCQKPLPFAVLEGVYLRTLPHAFSPDSMPPFGLKYSSLFREESRADAFFDFSQMPLKDFRPGIKSFARLGEQLILAVMTIESGMRDEGHAHPFDQCGIVLEGVFSLTIGGRRGLWDRGRAILFPPEFPTPGRSRRGR